MPGPYVQLAAVCERVLQERDGVLSLVRVIDRWTVVAPQGAPDELPEGGILGGLTYVVALRSGDARGRHRVSVVIEAPDGTTSPEGAFDVMFEAEDQGANLLVNLGIQAIEGLYWLIVRLDGEQEMTRTPFRIIYQRIPGVP